METIQASELQLAADRAARGVRDREDMLKACEEMDRIREDVKRRVGVVNAAVDLVREARNEE
jgi:hypothetical protein